MSGNNVSSSSPSIVNLTGLTATQSAPWTAYGSSSSAHYAVDGNTAKYLGAWRASATPNCDSDNVIAVSIPVNGVAWLMVDLQAVQAVQTVFVYGRRPGYYNSSVCLAEENCQSGGLTLSIGNSSYLGGTGNPVCVNQFDATVDGSAVACNMVGRYITISKSISTVQNMMSICQVVVQAGYTQNQAVIVLPGNTTLSPTGCTGYTWSASCPPGTTCASGVEDATFCGGVVSSCNYVCSICNYASFNWPSITQLDANNYVGVFVVADYSSSCSAPGTGYNNWYMGSCQVGYFTPVGGTCSLPSPPNASPNLPSASPASPPSVCTAAPFQGQTFSSGTWSFNSTGKGVRLALRVATPGGWDLGGGNYIGFVNASYVPQTASCSTWGCVPITNGLSGVLGISGTNGVPSHGFSLTMGTWCEFLTCGLRAWGYDASLSDVAGINTVPFSQTQGHVMPGGPGAVGMRHLSAWDTTTFQTSATGYHDIVVTISASKSLTFTIDGGTPLVSNYDASGYYLDGNVNLVIGGSAAVSNVDLTFVCP